MKILFCGDVMGRSGRDTIVEYVPKLREDLGLDCVIVNGENAARGIGITPKICKLFYQHGVDVITTGNHVWAQKEIISYIDSDPRLLRPLNYPKGTPGRGVTEYTLPDGRKVLVVNVMGRVFMDVLDDPFAAMKNLLEKYTLGKSVHAIIVDMHAEASSEKMSMGHYLDGSVSLVVGTHSHVPTADHMILGKGTAYQTDVGMCGDYDSVIGVKKEIPILRFTRKMPTERFSPADGEGTLCGLYVEIDDASGLATKVAPVRIGGYLSSTEPHKEN